MPIHIVKVIRELTDSVSYFKDKRPKSFCSDMEIEESGFWSPDTDIIEYEDRVVIKMELAGIERNDISVKVKNGMIQVCGLRYENNLNEPLTYHQLELNYGRFVKNILIPEFLEHNPITANLKDGILMISISKLNEMIEVPIYEKNKDS